MNSPPSQIPRLRTGVPGLDELLGGGLLQGRTVLLKGAPGSGKTTLGLQMLAAGALQFDEPAILLTFEQVPDQLYSDVAGFGWNLKELVNAQKLKLIFITPEEVLEAPGRQENRLLANVADYVEDTGARRIMIDSISHLRPLFLGEQARAQFMRFLVQLKKIGLTPVMTAELNANEGLSGLDAYLVDTVIHLSRTTGGRGRGERREIEIVKTRGSNHVGGVHPFEIGPSGLIFYPRLAPSRTELKAAGESCPCDSESQVETATPQPLPTGVPGLDPLLAGGYTPGSMVIAAGLSGTFKSTLALHFALSGPGPALWIGFHEDTAALRRSAAALAGAGPVPPIDFMEAVPGRDPIEKLLSEAGRRIAEGGANRVIIDGMNELTVDLAGEAEREEAVAWLLRRLRALGVTTLLTQRLARVTGLNPISEIANAELADTIIYLGLVEIESRLEKVISVLKHRGGTTEGDLRSIRADARGLRVSDRFVGLSGVLAGTPLGRRKAQIEEIFQPLYFIRDFLALAKDPAMASDQRGALLDQIGGETRQLIQLLSRYFDHAQPGTGAAGHGD